MVVPGSSPGDGVSRSRPATPPAERNRDVDARRGTIVRVRHDDGDRVRTIAATVTVADSILARARGLMLRDPDAFEGAMAFPFGGVGRRGIHTALVRFPIDIVWTTDDEVDRVTTLSPWRVGFGRADTVYEFHAGTAEGIETGDRVWIEK
ncbi:DUF192 domain-containing protein [Halobacteriales archaeon SW_7_68_16]|nr:MAG: DUF192 domain-containing protein [Halobacteriales archaeon SW_7_68_16]